jgi:hypothetical protein
VDEPVIVSYGRTRVSMYPEQEYVDCLTRAFIVGRADFITLDSNRRGQGFTSACIAWAIDKGWLYCSQHQEDDQSDVAAFRLADAGKEALGVACG